MASASRKVLVPIANRTEPMEAVITIDVLRRAGADVTVSSVEKQVTVEACHGVKIVADALISDCVDTVFDLISLPGGMLGATNLRDNNTLRNMVQKQASEGRLHAAICAAPAVVLGSSGLLKGLEATCYPSFMVQLILETITHYSCYVPDFHPKKTDLFCFCDSNNEIRYWNTNPFQCTRVSKGGSAQVRFEPVSGQLLAAASEKVLSIFNVETDRQTHSFQSVLGYELRKEGTPHDCLEDARTTMKLVLAKIESGVDNNLIPNQNDVYETKALKLLCHSIPINISEKNLFEIIPGVFTIESKPNKKPGVDKYSAFLVFKNKQEADEAFEGLVGHQDKDSSGYPQKLVSFKLDSGKDKRGDTRRKRK